MYYLESLPFANISLRFDLYTFAGDNNTLEDANITKPFCNNVNLSDRQMLIYRYSLVLVQYIIPVLVISFVYIQVSSIKVTIYVDTYTLNRQELFGRV